MISGPCRSLVRVVIGFSNPAVVESGQGQNDPDIHVWQGALYGISAFENGNVRLEAARQFGIAVRAKNSCW